MYTVHGKTEKKGDVKSMTGRPLKKKSIWRDRASWELLLLCVPTLICFTLFSYVPMIGIILPFKRFMPAKGLFGSPWVGLENFRFLFRSVELARIMRNTVLYSLWFMVIGPAVNVAIALLLFEVNSRRALKYYQTTISFPNFMSMVIIGYITYAILNPTMGVLNHLRGALGLAPIDVYTDPKYWPLILTIVNCWQGLGMGSMLYLSALLGADPTVYEAAKIDGANRWQQTIHVSIPVIVPILSLQLILSVGGLFGGSFELFYTIPRNVSVLYDTTDILSTYVMRGLQDGDYGRSSAVGLFQSVVGLILITGTNLVVKKISPENSIF